MEFVANPSPLRSSLFGSFGNLVERVKQIGTLAISAIIGNIFSAILTFCFALGSIPLTLQIISIPIITFLDLLLISSYGFVLFLYIYFFFIFWGFVFLVNLSMSMCALRHKCNFYLKFMWKNETWDVGVLFLCFVGLFCTCFTYVVFFSCLSIFKNIQIRGTGSSFSI